MKKLLKIGGVLAVIGILAGVYIWFFVYNKPHRDYEKATADVVISAQDCYQSIASGDASYSNKVLQLNGVPTSIEDLDSMVVVVFAFNEGMFGEEGIRCTMLPNYNSEALALGNSLKVEIKGKFQGYNGTDIILEHCSIIK